MESGVGTVTGIVLIGLEVFAGIFSNIFILFHIFRDFLRHRSVSSRNKILSALCVSSLCFTVMISVNELLGLMWSPASISIFMVCVIFVATMSSLSSCCWLTAGLCFFYFITILDFRSGLLGGIRSRIQRVVSWMILAVEMISLCGSLVNVQIFLSHETSLNINDSSGIVINPVRYLNIIYMVNILPFLIVMVTVVSTVASLFLHLHKMGKRREVSGKTEAHRGAMKTMLALLSLYTTFYIVMFTHYYLGYNFPSVESWIYLITMFSFSPLQATFLIYGDSKLRRSVITMSTWIGCAHKPA